MRSPATIFHLPRKNFATLPTEVKRICRHICTRMISDTFKIVQCDDEEPGEDEIF